MSHAPHTAKINDTEALRNNLLQTFIAAVVLAIGSGLIGSAVTIESLSVRWLLLVAGSLIIIGGLIAIFFSVAAKISGTTHLNGVFAIEAVGNEPVRIDRYDFSEKLCSIIRGIRSENKAIDRSWSGEDFFDFDYKDKKFRVKTNQSAKLAQEAIEYFVLDELSLHLSDYFNRNDIDDKLITHLTRSEIPSVLLTNRFVEHLSRPQEEREAFMEHSRPDDEFNGKVVYAIGKNGAIFNSIDISLPRNSVVSRHCDGSLKVDTKRFSISILCNLSFSTFSFPSNFEDLYLQRDREEMHAYSCDVKIQVKMHKLWMLTRSGWDHFAWLDSFLEKLHRQFSFSAFIEEIGWETALTSYILRHPEIQPKRS
ncbi:hypothetical protein G6M04_18645 [Agrobacterium rhizogenes]|uniref:hypothetical protein n=1 Tax=Rhizobium rhizogenes TaxID=359 RepID=UPI00157459AA|nr:hypothetical protein [Rhizobium rhizogenes]NTG49402.1 hypothetical protein [Rhizobium rhizogenes]